MYTSFSVNFHCIWKPLKNNNRIQYILPSPRKKNAVDFLSNLVNFQAIILPKDAVPSYDWLKVTKLSLFSAGNICDLMVELKTTMLQRAPFNPYDWIKYYTAFRRSNYILEYPIECSFSYAPFAAQIRAHTQHWGPGDWRTASSYVLLSEAVEKSQSSHSKRVWR